jgi:hypothetical protein
MFCQRESVALWQNMLFLTHFHLLSFNHCAVFTLETHRHGRLRLSHQREPPVVCLRR